MTKGQRNMTDYKLVPVEMALPCPFCGSSNIGNEYIETYSLDSSYDTFGCKDCGARFEDGCQDDWNRRAAPAVQGEPTGQRCEHCDGTGDVHSLDGEWRGTCDCMAEQQPAPDVSALVDALEEARDLVDSWSAYASDYFKEKHNLARDLERLDAVIAAHRKGEKI